MPFTSICKTVVHIYCSSMLFSTTAPAPISHQNSTEPSKSVPVLIKTSAEMTPIAPPDDRGSGR